MHPNDTRVDEIDLIIIVYIITTAGCTIHKFLSGKIAAIIDSYNPHISGVLPYLVVSRGDVINKWIHWIVIDWYPSKEPFEFLGGAEEHTDSCTLVSFLI
jgi:hypothetical protein